MKSRRTSSVGQAGPASLPRRIGRGLRTSVDQLARLSGYLGHRERERALDLTVLTYHRVLPRERCRDQPFPSLVMPLELFRQQVGWLREHGEILTLGAALRREGVPGARPVFVLTFDDGYDDAGEFAAVVLEEAGVRGTFFVTTDFVGSANLLWFDRAALLFSAVPEAIRRGIVQQVCRDGEGELPPAGADGAAWTRHLKGCSVAERAAILTCLEQAAGGAPGVDGHGALSAARLIEMHAAGHEIGSHTATHALLPTLTDAELEYELLRARATLQTWLGRPVEGFCYPNGDHDERVVGALLRAGHAYACTTKDGLHRRGDDPFRIPRVDMVAQRLAGCDGGLDVTALRRELAGLYRRRARALPTSVGS